MPVFLISFVEGLLGPKFARFAKPLIYLLLALLVLGALWGAKCSYDKHLISAHDSKQDASNAKADRRADQGAAVQRRNDDNRLAVEAQQLKEAQSNAHTDTDRSLARFKCIRLQQAARASNSVVPACN